MKNTVVRSVCCALAICMLACLAPILYAAAETGALLSVYFPNWNVYSDTNGQVKDLPWDRLDYINHAFWKIVPKDGGFVIESTDPWADTDKYNPKAHFPQYAEYAAKYPDTKIVLSIGGWTECGYFSEMSLTAESRASFIRSCLDTIDAYPFFSGIDIDWEYPGIARSGGDGDEGNPVLGDDKANYTLLLKELQEAFDEHYGPGSKLLTVCAGASISTLVMQDYAALYPYVDRVNLMTYDFAGSWNQYTGHQSPLYGKASADTAVAYLLSCGVPAEKIAIGSPLYSHSWKMYSIRAEQVGAAAKPMSGGDLIWRELAALEMASADNGAPGWHIGYDESAEAAYLWNDDPESPDYLVFHTYDSDRSIQAKTAYISEHGLGGLIVWQVHGDDTAGGWPMISLMYESLHR
ncbi:MAG: glycoside hydrolase family 18 protein [Clostridia bacterium]|nr:glycoside hydrolase family 18 protein [Clostridia bacterium]